MNGDTIYKVLTMKKTTYETKEQLIKNHPIGELQPNLLSLQPMQVFLSYSKFTALAID